MWPWTCPAVGDGHWDVMGSALLDGTILLHCSRYAEELAPKMLHRAHAVKASETRTQSGCRQYLTPCEGATRPHRELG